MLFKFFLNISLYVSNTLRKYYTYLSFKFLITLITFNFNLYYTVIPKLITDRTIIVYIYLTRAILYFYVNVISLINIIRYIVNLVFKTFL